MVGSGNWAMTGADGWASTVSVAADISVVAIAVGSLLVALLALRHQRKHDNRVIKHELKMAEPKVVWVFGPNGDGTLKISLINAGSGTAIRVRSTMVADGQEIEDWTWKAVYNAVHGDAPILNFHWYQTMPLSIASGKTVHLVEFGVKGLSSAQLLNKLLSNIQLRFYYKSNLEEKTLVTEWSSSRQLGIPV